VRFGRQWVVVIVIGPVVARQKPKPKPAVSYRSAKINELMADGSTPAFDELVHRMRYLLDRKDPDHRSAIIQKWRQSMQSFEPRTEAEAVRWLAKSANWAVASYTRTKRYNPLPCDDLAGQRVAVAQEHNEILLEIERRDPRLGEIARAFLNNERGLSTDEIEQMQALLCDAGIATRSYIDMLYAAQQSFPRSPDLVGQYFDFTTDEDLNAFVVTAVSSGTAAVTDNNSGPAGSNGVLLLSGAATTDDSGSNITGDSEWIRITSSKTVWFQTRVLLSDATESDLLAGIAITDTSLIASAPSDGIYFLKSDGAATYQIIVRVGSATNTVATFPALTAATWYDLAFRLAVDSGGVGTLTAWQDGTTMTQSRVASLPTSEALTAALAFQSGTATGTIYAGVDNIGVWANRV